MSTPAPRSDDDPDLRSDSDPDLRSEGDPPRDTYRLARPASSTGRSHDDPPAGPESGFVESRPAIGGDRPAARRPGTARKPPKHPLARLLLGRLPLETETTIFILVNLLDFFVTYWLLMAGGMGNMRFVESNPVARYFIESWGPVKGMLGFKLALVTFVCLVAQVIALQREDLGRKVLIFGTLATGGVVVYGLALYLRHA